MTINTLTKTELLKHKQNAVPKNTWLANLSLEFHHNTYGTRLVRTERNGPLSVQKAFYPEGKDCAHIYLLHPPAGIVSGDELRINIDVGKHAHSLITTPGANRFYRAREDQTIGDSKQVQHCAITLEDNATCENFPQETIVYEGADGFNTVDVHLTEQSCYLGWDITSLGLPSSNQPFHQGSYRQLNRVYCDNTLIYHDRIAIEPNSNIQLHQAGLNNCHVFATFLAYIPKERLTLAQQTNLVNELKALISQDRVINKIHYKNLDKKISITQIRQLFVIRYLGKQAEECKQLFTFLWQSIRPYSLQKEGIEPRIWHT